MLEYRCGLPVGHGLRPGVQRRIATIKNRAFERRVVQHLLGILKRGEPHAHVFEVDARRGAFLSVLRRAWVARIHREGHERNVLEDGLATAIPTCSQIGHVLHVSKGFSSNLDKEDGKGDVWRHMLYIDDNRISNGVVTIATHNCHQPGSLWEGILDTA